LLKKIQEGSEAALKEAMQQSDAMKESFRRNSELLNEVIKEKEDADRREFGFFAKLLEKENQIKDLQAKLAELSAGAAWRRPAGPPSTPPRKCSSTSPWAKPLSDVPVGTVVSVAGEKVLIEVFPDDRVEERLKLRTKLPFNVFAGGKVDGKFDRQLKGDHRDYRRAKWPIRRGPRQRPFRRRQVPGRGRRSALQCAWGTHVVVAGR